MKIELVDIDNALKYYQIKDTNYRNKCYRCIEDVNTIEEFNIRTQEIYNILYTDKQFKIDTLWKRQSMIELFRKQYNPFITSVLILLGYKLHTKTKIDIEKYFNIKNPEYRCDSWLLSNQINSIIDSDSNIAKFYRLFEVKDGPDATKDILNFVFNIQECDNYNNLIEDTSLQRLLKKQLIENKSIKIGWGKLKKGTLNSPHTV